MDADVLLTESDQGPDKYHILVVDDSKLQRKILLNWLQGSFHVSEAESGEQAFELLLSHKINLALVDVEMPGMNGFQLLERIKHTPELDHLPVILMSAADRTAESAAKSVEGGGQDYLFKPLIKELLIKKVETLLEIVQGNKRAAAYRAIVARKEQEILELKSKVSELDTFRQAALEALDTPIQAITRSISALMRDATIQASPIRAELQSILLAMSSTDLYKPAFAKIASQEHLDPVVGSYLLSEFASSDTKRNTPMPTFPELIHEDSIAGLKTWEFNQWELQEQDLLPLLKEMFDSFGLVQRFKIPVPKLERFIMKVRDSYRDNPYHNFRHAFDVTQTVYAVLTTMNAAKYLGHLDVLALLISAMCHDIGHPGTNNAFQVNTLSELAITYNDKAVLENYHCSTTFQMFQQPELNILEGLSHEEYHEIRKLIISCILATDPASHFESTTKLQQRIESGREFDRSNQEDRIMIMETILHLSDISNISKPWEVAKIWTDRVGDEFFRQGDLEKEKGMPVAPFMDRTKSSKARTSANFIDFVAVPLFQVVAQLLPETRGCLEYIADNRKRLEELIKAQSS